MMLRLRALLITALPLLTTGHQCSPQLKIHNSPVMDSLECYNDYTNHIRCTWENDPSTHLHIPVIENERHECIPEPHNTLLNRKHKASCIVNKPVFSRYEHKVFFNVSRPSKATLNLTQYGKSLPPRNLSEKEGSGGGRLLSWSCPYSLSSSLAHGLTYELQYRRQGSDWTVINLNTTERLIEKHMPGYSYEARVRARRSMGLWSDWSPSVSWTIDEDAIVNLQCVLEERGVTCNWQVKREEANFLSYQLCWGTDSRDLKCKHCACISEQWERKDALLDFTCSVDSCRPEQLMVEVRSHRRSKEFSDPYNIQSPQLLPVKVQKENGLLKLSWSRPNLRESLRLKYELKLQSENTQEIYNLTESDFSLDVPASSLLPSTKYWVQVRAVPGESFGGQPSEWSKAEYFISEPGNPMTPSYPLAQLSPEIKTILYVLFAILVAILFIIMYKALPACHRKLEVWKVSIPSPVDSRILKEMSSKKHLADSLYVSTEKEKTSMCIIQASDNPMIYTGSISTYPLLKYDSDSDSGLTQSKWTHKPRRSSSCIEGSGMSENSGMSFSGPYILCRQDSSSHTETSSVSFTSLSTLEEDIRSIPGSPEHSSPPNVGYVLSPPTGSLDHPDPSGSQSSESREPCQEKLLEDNPPAYTPNPVAMPTLASFHPSGYCVMPKDKDTSVAAWVPSPTPPAGGSAEIRIKEHVDGDSRARGYVTLSQPET